eukprot:1610753-Pyramimonas_sp.AAC.1
MGFRPQKGEGDALLILESVISKSFDWNVPVWMVSIDLKKAFDKVKYNTLFTALEQQGIDNKYILLLQRLRAQQTGRVGDELFPTRRGVRQGGGLSPMLFNSALKSVMRRWEIGLGQHGFFFQGREHGRLTNLRYADDLLIFGKSLAEAVEMVEILT